MVWLARKPKSKILKFPKFPAIPAPKKTALEKNNFIISVVNFIVKQEEERAVGMIMTSGTWQCDACTWFNDDIEHESACQMCLIERRRPWKRTPGSGSSNSKKKEESRDVVAAVAEVATSNESYLNNSCDARSDTLWTEPVAESLKSSFAPPAVDENSKVEDGRWDAFASLQSNYESSEEEEEEDSSGDGGSDDGDSVCSDGDFIEDDGIDGESDEDSYDDHSCHERQIVKETRAKIMHNPVECINLLDSDDDVIQSAGKENEKSRPSHRTTRRSIEPEDGSDSSLSEVESHRPLPSPLSARRLSPWQPPRRRRSIPIQTNNSGNIKSVDHFPCMSRRNDVIGISSSSMVEDGPRWNSEQSKEGRANPHSEKASTLAKTSLVASTTIKRKRATTSKTTAAASKGGMTKEAPAKKKRRGGGGGRKGKFRRKKSSYKRSTKGGGSSRAASAYNERNNENNGNGNAWSERERGIRQPYRRGAGGGVSGGSSSGATYMAIAKQEPMLRNVGGASIQF